MRKQPKRSSQVVTCNAKIGLQPANATGQQSTKANHADSTTELSREEDVGKAVAEAGDAETDAALARALVKKRGE